MIKNTPNETQKGILEGYGVIPAPTGPSCNALVKFIEQGNLLIGRNQAERIAIVRDLQKEWIGQRAEYKEMGVSGVVTYIIPLPRGAFTAFGTRNLEQTREASFTAILRLDSGRTRQFRLSNLCLVSSPRNQTR